MSQIDIVQEFSYISTTPKCAPNHGLWDYKTLGVETLGRTTLDHKSPKHVDS